MMFNELILIGLWGLVITWSALTRNFSPTPLFTDRVRRPVGIAGTAILGINLALYSRPRRGGSFIAMSTMQTHVSRIYGKMEVNSKTERHGSWGRLRIDFEESDPDSNIAAYACHLFRGRVYCRLS